MDVDKKRKQQYGKHCIAPGCRNWYYKAKEKHYHTLPLGDKDRMKVWLQKLKRKNVPVNSNSKVCSDHFTKEDYVLKGNFDSFGCFQMVQTKDLKDGAFPSVFNFSEYNASATDAPSTSSTGSLATKVGRSERLAKRIKRQKIQEVKLCRAS